MPSPRNRPSVGTELLPVFVYGTLRPGGKNHDAYLKGETTGELPAWCRGQLYYVEKEGYPYLLPGDGEVAGTLAFLRAETYAATLNRLDRLEDYDPEDEKTSLYLRRITRARLVDGRLVRAWVYYWNCPRMQGRRIESGDFFRR